MAESKYLLPSERNQNPKEYLLYYYIHITYRKGKSIGTENDQLLPESGGMKCDLMTKKIYRECFRVMFYMILGHWIPRSMSKPREIYFTKCKL